MSPLPEARACVAIGFTQRLYAPFRVEANDATAGLPRITIPPPEQGNRGVCTAGTNPSAVIISRTPLRISFAGGGSDLPAFYRRESGAVVATAISKYIYITVNKKFDTRIRASYSITEMVDRVEDLRHDLIREALRMTGITGGIEITSISDIPSTGTGLGSSSAYTVGLLHALHAYSGRYVGAARLAEEACQIELDRCHRPIGKQDQYVAAYGGLQFLQFDAGSVSVEPLLPGGEFRQALHEHLLLLYTGLSRNADVILADQQRGLDRGTETVDETQRLRDLALDLRAAVLDRRLGVIGEILDASWTVKRRLAPGVTTPRIDEWYERARAAGAVGGKLLGAGGGGFLLVFAAPQDHETIVQRLPELQRVPFHFEPHGSRIIYVEE
jgi:D-glycero-alpha-D-manno-heptose-7-phosphate kinase